MFSKPEVFEKFIDTNKQKKEIEKIIQQFPNPEHINNNPSTAPSKRLKKIMNYSKSVDSEIIFDNLPVEEIINKCPRFAKWTAQLKEIILNNEIK